MFNINLDNNLPKISYFSEGGAVVSVTRGNRNIFHKNMTNCVQRLTVTDPSANSVRVIFEISNNNGSAWVEFGGMIEGKYIYLLPGYWVSAKRGDSYSNTTMVTGIVETL